MAKELTNTYFVLAEATSIDVVDFVAGQLIVTESGQAYYDPTTGTSKDDRIIIGDQKGIEAAVAEINETLESMDETIADLQEQITALDGKIDAHAAVAGSADTAGHVKLYAEVGDNTDGAMTQASVKTALAGKADATHSHAQSEVTGLENALTALSNKDNELVAADQALDQKITKEAGDARAAEKAIADDLAAYKTSNNAAVEANTAAIATLNGDANTAGSVDYKVAAEVAKILNDNDASDIDTLEEIAAWIKNDTAGVGALNAKVTANEAAIKTINETTIPAVDAKADKNAEDILALDGELEALSGTVTSNAGSLAAHIAETATTADPHGIATMKAALEAQIQAIGKIVRYTA